MNAQRRAPIAITMAAALTATLAACQPADSGGGSDGGEMDRVASLSIATGGTSGVYYPIGGALSGIIDEHVEGTSASVEATGASVENIRLIGSGSADIAIAQGDSVDQAYTGTVDFEDGAVETNAIAVLYPNVYHTVTLASIKESQGLECFSDLEGKRFSVGDVGSGNETTSNQVFDSLGLDVNADITRSQLGYSETANALSSGGLDAGAWVVGEGHGGINELAATDDIALVPMCEDEIASIVDGAGGYTEHTIPAGTYTGVDEDVTTIAVWNVLVVPAGFNDDQAHEITEAIFDNVDDITEVYAGAADYLTLDNAENSPVTLHPGAIRYFEENGVEIPEHLKGLIMRWRRAWPAIAAGLVVIAAVIVPLRQALTITAEGETLAVWPPGVVTIRYVHSIDHLPIEEDLSVRGGELIVERTRLKQFGAGMGQIEGEGTGRAEGEWWVIDDLDRAIGPELHIRAGAIGVDHRISNGDREIPLSACLAGTRITVAVERVPMTRYAFGADDICDT